MIIELGDKVRDSVTGFTGVAVCRVEWMYGCTRFGVLPHVKRDGSYVEMSHFDEPQLIILKKHFVMRRPTKPIGPPAIERNGGPMPKIKGRDEPKSNR